MGASSSADQKCNTQQQKDIAYLGDRMPFGDAELLQVYRVYQKLQDKLRNDNVGNHGDKKEDPPSSFIKDVGVLSATEIRHGAKKKSDLEFH